MKQEQLISNYMKMIIKLFEKGASVEVDTDGSIKIIPKKK